MPKSTLGAWRSFSTLAQVAIATAQASGQRRYEFEGDFIEPQANTFYMNEAEATGGAAPDNHLLLNRKYEGSHGSKLFPDLAGIMLASVLGQDSVAAVGATAAYRHTITPALNPDSCVLRTVLENDGTNQKQYLGVAVKSVTLKGSRGEFMTLEANLIGRGAEATDATAKPANSGESYLHYQQVNFTKGGTFDGTSVSGGTSMSAALIDFEAGFDNNAVGDYHFGDATGLVGAIAPNLTNKYGLPLSANFEMEDETLRNDLLAGTEFVVSIPMVGGVADGAANYEVNLIYPRVVLKEVNKRRQDGRRRMAASFAVLSDPTYGAVVAQVVNLHASSYVATS